MGISTIDAGMLKNAFLAGAKGLEAKKDWINELNVFPVPDGDTGTNMTLTIMAAAKEVAELENPTMDQLAKAISSGSLRGARGNSGVILSQLLRGFTKEIKAVEEIDTTILANAMVRGTETAYKACLLYTSHCRVLYRRHDSGQNGQCARCIRRVYGRYGDIFK